MTSAISAATVRGLVADLVVREAKGHQAGRGVRPVALGVAGPVSIGVRW